MMRRQVGVVVAGGGHHEDAGVVERVHGVGPCLRRQATHAHGEDMDTGRRIATQRVHVVEGLGDRAVAEQHHPVGDADRDHLGIRRAAKPCPRRPARRKMLSVPVP